MKFIVNVEQYLLTYGISKVVLILNERDIAENSLRKLYGIFSNKTKLSEKNAPAESDKTFTKMLQT